METSRPRIGVLLVNIGSPDAPAPGPVRRYLAEFLSDPRIVELPRWLWLPILHGIILNVRAIRSARAYGRVWRQEGSPLIHHSREIAARLQTLLDERMERSVTVGIAMRYGKPSIGSALEGFRAVGIERVLVVPLHPQYCGSTVGSTFDGVGQALARQRWVPDLRFISGYHEHPEYIGALAASVREHWQAIGGRQHLLLSYHSIPVAYARKGDPYPEQVRRTSELLASALGLRPTEWSLGFQSRFVAGRWLEPSTETVLTQLAASGIRRVSVMSPVFATDCLETLDDLVIRATAHFRAAGGIELSVIPALNAQPAHVEFLAALAAEQMSGWLAGAPVVSLAARRSLR